MQFYDGRDDENLGIPILVAASAATKAAGAFSALKSMFGGGSNENMARGFSKRTGTGRLYSDAEKNAIVARASAAGIDPLRMARIEAGMEQMPGNVASNTPNAGNIDNVFSQRMATGKMYTVAEKNELQRRADAAGVPVNQIAWNDKRGGFSVKNLFDIEREKTRRASPPVQNQRNGVNIARTFSLRAATGREYTDAEKNALVMRGARIGVSGEQMARIEAGIDTPPFIPRKFPSIVKPEFNVIDILNSMIKPSNTQSTIGPSSVTGYGPPQQKYPDQAFTRERPLIIDGGGEAPRLPSTKISPAGTALILGGGYLLTRKSRR